MSTRGVWRAAWGMARLLGLAIAAPCVARAQAPAALGAAQAAAIGDSVRAMLAAFNADAAAGRWEAMVGWYDDRPAFRWVENGVVRYRSRDDIRRGLAALPPGLRVETRYTDTEVTALAPGVALLVTAFETTFTGMGPQPFRFGGLLTATVVRRAEGWRFASGHSSSPPPPGSPGDRSR
ncbi:MAG: nuclear transport factor 2 family protein [Gemmatimonadales bacterium]|nr:nuclear transport factor 2 family protein [Gemmatimonadales bacterium]